jgi:FixJ family two-component response regulator
MRPIHQATKAARLVARANPVCSVCSDSPDLDNLHAELSNKDIAEHLFVSPRTVQAHLSHA